MAVGGLLFGSCKAQKEAPAADLVVKENRIGGSGSAMIVPKATVFKMSGDYADNVAVTLNPDGSLAYYPAPTDVGPYSAPIALGDGWYLNVQGISANSVFTKYKFKEYAALKEPPTHKELIEAVIPGARVTEFRQLPITASEARSNPEICRRYLP